MTDRGALLTAEEIQQRYLKRPDGTFRLSTRWVYEHVRPRVDIARGVVLWYEKDVDAFFLSKRAA